MSIDLFLLRSAPKKQVYKFYAVKSGRAGKSKPHKIGIRNHSDRSLCSVSENSYASVRAAYNQPHITLPTQMRNKRKSTLKGNWNTFKFAWKASLLHDATVIHFDERMRARILRQVTWHGASIQPHATLNMMGTGSANDLLKEETRTRMQQYGDYVCVCSVYMSVCTATTCDWTNIEALLNDNISWN